MKTKRIHLGKNQAPIDALAQLGSETKNALIFLDKKAAERQFWSAYRWSAAKADDTHFCSWDDIAMMENDTPHHCMFIEEILDDDGTVYSYLISQIKSDAVAFSTIPKFPDVVIFITA